MPSGRVIFACSLAASVAVHVIVWRAVPRYYALPDRSRPKYPTAKLTIVPPATPTPIPPPESIFGEAVGGGVALNASPGDRPQASPNPLVDQSAFTRDPTGDGPLAPAAPKPLAAAVTAASPAALPTPPASPLPAFRKAERATTDPPPPDATPPPDAKPTRTTTPVPPRPETTATPPSPAGGTPLPHSDRDSDPFAKQWSAEFRRGEVVAQRGRQQKLVRPRINLGAVVQAAEIRFPCTTKFHVRIDDDGRVRNATIVASSGSPSIDRAFLLSVYESWFEPAKDDAGKAVGDEFDFGWTIPR